MSPHAFFRNRLTYATVALLSALLHGAAWAQASGSHPNALDQTPMLLAGPDAGPASQSAVTAAPSTQASTASTPIALTPVQPMASRLAACLACHGQQDRTVANTYYPRISGKPAGYLYKQLQHFRDGQRHFPSMQYLIAPLSDAYLHDIARYFAEQHPIYPAPALPDASAAVLARGQQLVRQGDASRKIPACASCHGQAMTGIEPAIPGLLGLSKDYLQAQFGAWRNGSRRATAPDCMAQVARQLSDDDIQAAVQWLITQRPASYAPAPANPTPLPLPCSGLPTSAIPPQTTRSTQ